LSTIAKKQEHQAKETDPLSLKNKVLWAANWAPETNVITAFLYCKTSRGLAQK
jgi:hypothetical protein